MSVLATRVSKNPRFMGKYFFNSAADTISSFSKPCSPLDLSIDSTRHSARQIPFSSSQGIWSCRPAWQMERGDRIDITEEASASQTGVLGSRRVYLSLLR